MIEKKILNLIKSKISVEHIYIEDLTHKHQHHKHYNGGGHFKLTVISDDFINLSLIKRHRLVYSILADMLKAEIHALSMITKTTAEYK